MSFLNGIWDLILPYWHMVLSFYRANEKIVDIALMPITYGFVGWITNWQAVKMIFWPMKFWGIPPYLGWQGILPRKAPKFALRTADYLESKLVRLPEIFARLDARTMAKKLEPVIDDLVDDVVNEIFDKSNPLVWRIVPSAVRREIINASRMQAPKAVRLVIKDIQQNIDDIFDVRELAVESMTGPNVNKMVDLVKAVGNKEFKFIERSGFYFGFLLGLVQVVIWWIYPALWTLPIQGVIVGYITNWLAIYMIFSPLEEKRYFFFFKWQGLFIKRKLEVAKAFTSIVCKDVLTSRNIIKKIVTGSARDRIHLIIRMAVSQAIDRMATVVKPIITSSLDSDTLDVIKHEMTMELTSEAATKYLEDYVQKSLNIEQLMMDRFSKLTSEEFEELLRPIFHEDEWILIVVGAVLGGAVGCFQLFLMMF